MLPFLLTKPSPEARKFRLDDALILLNLASGELFGYNETARSVWDALDGGNLNENWVNEFAGAHGVAPARFHADICEIIEHWRSAGLISFERSQIGSAPDEATMDRLPQSAPRWLSSWKCKIRGKTFAFAFETAIGAHAYNLLKHLEVQQSQADILLHVRSTHSGEMALIENGEERFRTKEEAQLIGGVWQAIVEHAYPDIQAVAFMHGAAFEFEGKGFGLCAPSGSGKTTLVAALLAEGFDYLSDDMIGLSSIGSLIPVPLPLSIKPGSIDVLQGRHASLKNADKYLTKGFYASLLLPPTDAWEKEPMPFGQLIFPKYVSGAKSEVKKLNSFDAFQRLAAERLWLGDPITEARVRQILEWVSKTPAYSITYGNVDSSIELVREILH